MLPEYPELRTELENVLWAFLRNRVRAHQGPFGEVPVTRIMEGETLSIVRPGQPTKAMNLREFKAELSFKDAELVDLHMGDVLQKLEDVAKTMAAKTSAHFMQTIADVTDTPDRTAVSSPSEITPEVFLAGLEKVQIDFDDQGEPVMPTLIVPPGIRDRLKSTLGLLDTDPHWRRKLEKIMVTKREEWRAREANRVLVG